MLINTGNISRKVLSKVLRSFVKNFERPQSGRPAYARRRESGDSLPERERTEGTGKGRNDGGRNLLSGGWRNLAQGAAVCCLDSGGRESFLVRQTDPETFSCSIPVGIAEKWNGKNDGEIVQNEVQYIKNVKICNSFFASCRFYVILQTVNHGGICASILINVFYYILLYYQRRAENI